MSLIVNNIFMGSNDIVCRYKVKLILLFYLFWILLYCGLIGFIYFGFKFEEILIVWDVGGLK